MSNMKLKVLVLLVVAVVFSGVASAAEVVILDDFSIFDGYSKENQAELSHNTDVAFVKEGTGSLRVDKGAGDARSMTRVRNYHRNWTTDLTPFNRLGVWIYFEDVSVLRPDAAFGVSFWHEGGSKTGFLYSVDQFVNGWNFAVVDLTDPQKYMNRSNMELIELQIRTADVDSTMTYYYDEIQVWWED